MEWHQWFPHIIKHKYAEFSGVATRSEFWFWQLSCLIYGFALFFISLLLPFVAIFYLLFSLFVFIPTLAVGARRLHDIGQSGHLQWIILIPVLGGIALLVLWCQPSKANTQYITYSTSLGQQPTPSSSSGPAPPAILDGPTPGNASVTPPGVTDPTPQPSTGDANPSEPKERPTIKMKKSEPGN